MRVRPYLLLVGALLFMSVGLFDNAETKTIEAGDATASWTGKGVIDDLEDGDSVFSGTITGTMFIRHPEGKGHALIHAAKIECQTMIRISGAPYGSLYHDGA